MAWRCYRSCHPLVTRSKPFPWHVNCYQSTSITISSFSFRLFQSLR
jgi:hypothetical protein